MEKNKIEKINKNSGISLKRFFAIVIVCIMLFVNAITVSVLGYVYYSNLTDTLEKEKAEEIRTMANLMYSADNPSQPSEVWKKTLEALAMEKDTKFVRVIDLKSGSIIYSSIKGELPGASLGDLPQFTGDPIMRERILDNLWPINEYSLLGKDSQGVWVGINKTSMQNVMYLTVFFTLFLTLLLAVLAFFALSKLISKLVLNPFNYIINRIFELKKGNLDAKISSETMIVEINELGSALDEMRGEFKKSRERDQSISKLKTEFVTVAAHQLRTPLTSIKWVVNMLYKESLGALNGEQKTFLEKAIESTNRMMSLINDLLNITKIEEGKFDIVLKDEDITAIVREAIEDAYVLAAAKSIKINFLNGDKKYPPVKADKEKIKLAFGNILTNAIKYSPEKSSVDVGLEIFKNKYVMATVKDSGIGIPKDQQARVFAKFFRAENAVRVQTEGSGLGLFISQNIIKAHGGKIWFESEINKGTTVYFILPVQIPKKPRQVEKFLTDL